MVSQRTVVLGEVFARLESSKVAEMQLSQLEEEQLAELKKITGILGPSRLPRAGCSDLELAASLGRQDLLRAVLKRSQAFPLQPNTALKQDIRNDLAAALLAAVHLGHTECARLLIDWSVSISPSASYVTAQLLDARDEDGCTALMAAARRGNEECMRLLLEHMPDAQVAAVGVSGWTALVIAISFGKTACVPILLAHSPHLQVTALDERGMNALMHEALNDGPASCVPALLAHSPEVQVVACSAAGKNALMYAAGAGNHACMEHLLAHSPGVQLAARDAEGVSALDIVVAHARVECLKVLLSHRPAGQQLDEALTDIHDDWRHAMEHPRMPADEKQRHAEAFKRCTELLLAAGAMLGSEATAADVDWVRGINKDLAARALVPDMANEAVVGLASAACKE